MATNVNIHIMYMRLHMILLDSLSPDMYILTLKSRLYVV